MVFLFSDFGLQGVLDRFGQIEPKVLIACDGYFYNGKTHDIRKDGPTVSGVPSIQRVIIVPYVLTELDISGIRDAVDFTTFVGNFTPADIQFAQMPFSHPLYILYSSGTTDQPKCTVHEGWRHAVEACGGAGGAIFHRADTGLLFTTLGWM